MHGGGWGSRDLVCWAGVRGAVPMRAAATAAALAHPCVLAVAVWELVAEGQQLYPGMTAMQGSRARPGVLLPCPARAAAPAAAWAHACPQRTRPAAPSHGVVILQVTQSGLRPTIPDSCPPALADLIERCWHNDPAQRCARLQGHVPPLHFTDTQTTPKHFCSVSGLFTALLRYAPVPSRPTAAQVVEELRAQLNALRPSAAPSRAPSTPLNSPFAGSRAGSAALPPSSAGSAALPDARRTASAALPDSKAP